jgi:hypothetical protein
LEDVREGGKGGVEANQCVAQRRRQSDVWGEQVGPAGLEHASGGADPRSDGGIGCAQVGRDPLDATVDDEQVAREIANRRVAC